jgi:hypothetical protein
MLQVKFRLGVSHCNVLVFRRRVSVARVTAGLGSLIHDDHDSHSRTERTVNYTTVPEPRRRPLSYRAPGPTQNEQEEER